MALEVDHALIRVGIGEDGGLIILIDKRLWTVAEELKQQDAAAAKAAAAKAKESDPFMRVKIAGLSDGGMQSFSFFGKVDEPPCPPFTTLA